MNNKWIINNTKINTIFMNSENNETSDPHRLSHNFTHEETWDEKINILLYQILVFVIYEKI